MLSDILKPDALTRWMTPSAIAKGRAYQAEQYVIAIEVSDDGTDIRGKVLGSGTQAYGVEISLKISKGSVSDISGLCDCPMTFNCKHVVAILLEGLAREKAPIAAPVPATPPNAQPPAQSTAAVPAPAVLPPPIQIWLEKMTGAARGDDYPPDIAQRLLYILQPRAYGAELPQLTVTIVSVRLLKDGRFSDVVATVRLSAYQANKAPKFYRAADIDILRALGRYDVNGIAPVAEMDAVRRMVETGRAYWLDTKQDPLRWGPARDGRVEWRLTDKAELRPYLVVDEAVALHTEPAIYADPASGLLGPVELGLPPRLAHQLLSAPPLAPAIVAQVASRLGRALPGLRTDFLPAPPEPAREITADPVPILRLGLGRLVFYAYGYGYKPPGPAPIAKLSFGYGPVELGMNERATRVEAVLDGRLYEIVRRPTQEKAALATLNEFGFEPARQIHPQLDTAHGRDLSFPEAHEWLDFLHMGLPELRDEGFDVRIDDDFPYRLASSSGEFDAEIESSGIDWFELGLGIDIDGERHDLAPALAAMIRTPGFDPAFVERLAEADEHLYLPLSDGRLLAVAAARFVPLLLALHMIGPDGFSVSADKAIRLSRADIAPLLGFEDQYLTFKAADNLRQLAGLLQSRGLPEPALPAGFKAVLRPYQAEGVAWLDLLRESGLGGILADDMGLGKTVQILALAAMEKARGHQTDPVLIVAPTSLMTNWQTETRKCAPDLKVLLLHGAERKQAFDTIADHDIVLTTYPLIARDHTVLLARNWHMAILDEAQTIKNPNATTTRTLAGIKARHRFCLTGTPMENHLGELWSLMSFVNPGFLGDKTTFARSWRTPIEKRGDTVRSKALARRVKPFLLRRTKAEVATELPPKTEVIETIVLEGKQRDLYDSVRIAMAQKVRQAIGERGLGKSHIIVLEALLKLRQACCDPRLLKLGDKIERPSAKLERLMEMVEELRSEGRKIILFSQFTSMLDLIRARFDAAAIRYSLLTGQTKDRASAITDFQNGVNDVFLISLKAGGVGLNLTAADTVIIFDPWWNPAVEEQAIDRAYRIGQDKSVFVYRMVAAGTIEEKMDELKARKRALADGLFDHDGQIGAALTEEDVAALFEG